MSQLEPAGTLRALAGSSISTGHAFVQNLYRGHYEVGLGEPTTLRAASWPWRSD